MPFVDDDQLATLYKEVEQEKKAATYFQKLHQKNKQALKLLKLYRYGSVLLLFVLFVLVVIFSGHNKRAKPQMKCWVFWIVLSSWNLKTIF